MEVDKGRNPRPAVRIDEELPARFNGSQRAGFRIGSTMGKDRQHVKALGGQGLDQGTFECAVGIGKGMAGKEQPDGRPMDGRMDLSVGRNRIVDLRGRRVEDPLPGQRHRGRNRDGRIMLMGQKAQEPPIVFDPAFGQIAIGRGADGDLHRGEPSPVGRIERGGDDGLALSDLVKTGGKLFPQPVGRPVKEEDIRIVGRIEKDIQPSGVVFDLLIGKQGQLDLLAVFCRPQKGGQIGTPHNGGDLDSLV